jgi:hypothetical protein
MSASYRSAGAPLCASRPPLPQAAPGWSTQTASHSRTGTVCCQRWCLRCSSVPSRNLARAAWHCLSGGSFVASFVVHQHVARAVPRTRPGEPERGRWPSASATQHSRWWVEYRSRRDILRRLSPRRPAPSSWPMRGASGSSSWGQVSPNPRSKKSPFAGRSLTKRPTDAISPRRRRLPRSY